MVCIVRLCERYLLQSVLMVTSHSDSMVRSFYHSLSFIFVCQKYAAVKKKTKKVQMFPSMFHIDLNLNYLSKGLELTFNFSLFNMVFAPRS